MAERQDSASSIGQLQAKSAALLKKRLKLQTAMGEIDEQRRQLGRLIHLEQLRELIGKPGAVRVKSYGARDCWLGDRLAQLLSIRRSRGQVLIEEYGEYDCNLEKVYPAENRDPAVVELDTGIVRC